MSQLDSAQALVTHWIGGRLVTALGSHNPVFNPAHGRQVREVALATIAEVDAAVQSAANAFRAWAEVPPPRRARLMFRFQELLTQNTKRIARVLSEEHGKTLPDAEAEVARGIEVVEFACGAPQLLKGEFSDNVGAGVDSYSLRQPLGVVAGITPLHFPVVVPIFVFL